MAPLNKKIKASTMVEILVAMVILTVITTILFMIIININKQTNTGLYTRAKYTVDDIFYRTLKNKEFEDSRFDYKNFYITKQVRDYKENTRLKTVKVAAFMTEGKLLVKKQIVIESKKDNSSEYENW